MNNENATILHTMFEALFERALKPSPELIADLRKVGFDIQRPQTEYPLKVFISSLDVARTHLVPQFTRAQAHHHFGKLVGSSFFDTLVGRVLGAALPFVGPDRLVQTLPKRMETGGRGGPPPTITQVAEKRYRLSFGDDAPLLEFAAGAVAAALDKCGVKAEVKPDPESPRTGLVITWA